MARSWVKLHTDILEEPWFFRLSQGARSHYLLMIALAGRIDDNGNLGRVEDLPFRLHCLPTEIDTSLQELIGHVIVEDGLARLNNWESRQAPSRTEDDRAGDRDRQQKRRAVSQNGHARDIDVTQDGHAPVTSPREEKKREDTEETREEPADACAHAPTHAHVREEAPRAGTTAAALPSAGEPLADCDAEDSPQPPVTEEGLVQAICDVRRLDPARLDRPTQRATASLAAWCMSQDPPVSPDEARAWGAEWYSDMRRKKGAVKIGPPSLGQLSEWMARMVRECEGSAMLSRGVLGGSCGRDSAAAAGGDGRTETSPAAQSPPGAGGQSEAERLWARVAADMELRLMRSAWESQVKPVRAVALEGAVLTVEAPSEAVKGWLEERLLGTVRELLAGAAGRAVDVAVVTAGGAA